MHFRGGRGVVVVFSGFQINSYQTKVQATSRNINYANVKFTVQTCLFPPEHIYGGLTKTVGIPICGHDTVSKTYVFEY